MATIIRKADWSNNATEAVELRKTSKYLHLISYTLWQGSYDKTYRLPLSLEAELTAAIDNDTIRDWMECNLDESDVWRKERVC